MPENGKDGAEMNVLYQTGLEDVARQLREMGHAVYPMESRIRADAVIYTSDVRAAMRVEGASGGTPLVCVRGMSAGEISEALARRGCAGLFA